MDDNLDLLMENYPANELTIIREMLEIIRRQEKRIKELEEKMDYHHPDEED